MTCDYDTILSEKIDDILGAYPFGLASAKKRGRNPKWPWVPIIDYGVQKIGIYRSRTKQIRGLAFSSREEAVFAARQCIDKEKADLLTKIHDPRYRALREQFGLPRELQNRERAA